jgi:hypothetical protein
VVVVVVAVGDSLGLGEPRSLEALAAAEDLALGSQDLVDLRSPEVLLVAWRTARSWSVAGVTLKIQVKPHSLCVP